MTTSTHTPGPWRVAGPCPTDAAEFNVRDQHGALLFITGPMYNNYERAPGEMRANALLAASAPELLAALQRFDRYMEQHSTPELQGIWADAAAAIAAATGGA